MVSEFKCHEITKVINKLIGATDPVADSNIDSIVKENVKLLIDVTNWCLDGLYQTASNRHSPYGSQHDVGELAYSAMLQLKDWLQTCEEELA